MSNIYSLVGVTLDMQNGEYIVSSVQNGQNLEFKTPNPIMALNYFTGQINYVLAKRLSKYLGSQGKNKYTGCDQLELTCHECKKLGENITNNCPLNLKEDEQIE